LSAARGKASVRLSQPTIDNPTNGLPAGVRSPRHSPKPMTPQKVTWLW
jgi:hypothetical protein